MQSPQLIVASAIRARGDPLSVCISRILEYCRDREIVKLAMLLLEEYAEK